MKTIFTTSVRLRSVGLFHQVAGVSLLCLFSPGAAHAYIDPGSGSVIVTTILGLLAAIGYTFRKYLYKIKCLLTTDSSESLNEDSESDPSAPE